MTRTFRASTYGATARKRGIAFDLTDAQLQELLGHADGARCPCCEKVMLHGRASRTTPSLDRVRNDRGYTMSNVVVICKRCNEIKRDLSGRELLRLAQFVLAAEARAF